GDGLAPRLPGPVEGEAEEAAAGRLGDDLEALHHAGDDLVLDGGVQVLGQLADDEHVHALEAGPQAGQVLQRPDRGEQAEAAAEVDVEVAALLEVRQGGVGGRRQQACLEDDAVAAGRGQQLVGDGGPALLDGGPAGEVLVPVDV